MKKQSRLLTAVLTLMLLGFFTAKMDALEFLTEVKAGYFYPTNHRFQKIYHDGDGIYGAEVTCELCNNWSAWASANYFGSDGRSIGGHNRTSIIMVPLALGGKYFFPTCYDLFDPYVGAGVLATWLHLRDHSPFVIPRSQKWGFGGIFKAGAIIDICDGFFADIFVDYSIVNIRFNDTDDGLVTRQNAHLDGLSAGVGIGYRF